MGSLFHPESAGLQLTLSIDGHHALAIEGFALGILETLHRELATVIHADNLQSAGSFKEHLIFSPRTQIAVLIYYLHIDKGRGLSLIVGSQTQMVGLSCGLDGLRSHNRSSRLPYGQSP